MQTCSGSAHNFNLYQQTCPDWLPKKTSFLTDSGYQGIAKLHKQTFTPSKKHKGAQLIKTAKQANQYLIKSRILVEHK